MSEILSKERSPDMNLDQMLRNVRTGQRFRYSGQDLTVVTSRSIIEMPDGFHIETRIESLAEPLRTTRPLSHDEMAECVAEGDFLRHPDYSDLYICFRKIVSKRDDGNFVLRADFKKVE